MEASALIATGIIVGLLLAVAWVAWVVWDSYANRR